MRLSLHNISCVCWLLSLQVANVGDALSDEAAVDGGAAGIIVDLFANGQLIPQLTQVWNGRATEALHWRPALSQV